MQLCPVQMGAVPPGHECRLIGVAVRATASPYCHTGRFISARDHLAPQPKGPLREKSRPERYLQRSNRVGDELTPTPLPHHRTCGSAYGGSTNTLESLLLAHQ